MKASVKLVGSRAEVFHGSALRTTGRLTKDDLMKNKAGRIVSRKRHDAGKGALRYLHAKGYIAVKGAFGCIKKSVDALASDAPAAACSTDASPPGISSDPSAL
jgi:hypothetical protein